MSVSRIVYFLNNECLKHANVASMLTSKKSNFFLFPALRAGDGRGRAWPGDALREPGAPGRDVMPARHLPAPGRRRAAAQPAARRHTAPAEDVPQVIGEMEI